VLDVPRDVFCCDVVFALEQAAPANDDEIHSGGDGGDRGDAPDVTPATVVPDYVRERVRQLRVLRLRQNDKYPLYPLAPYDEVSRFGAAFLTACERLESLDLHAVEHDGFLPMLTGCADGSNDAAASTTATATTSEAVHMLPTQALTPVLPFRNSLRELVIRRWADDAALIAICADGALPSLVALHVHDPAVEDAETWVRCVPWMMQHLTEVGLFWAHKHERNQTFATAMDELADAAIAAEAEGAELHLTTAPHHAIRRLALESCALTADAVLMLPKIAFGLPNPKGSAPADGLTQLSLRNLSLCWDGAYVLGRAVAELGRCSNGPAASMSPLPHPYPTNGLHMVDLMGNADVDASCVATILASVPQLRLLVVSGCGRLTFDRDIFESVFRESGFECTTGGAADGGGGRPTGPGTTRLPAIRLRALEADHLSMQCYNAEACSVMVDLFGAHLRSLSLVTSQPAARQALRVGLVDAATGARRLRALRRLRVASDGDYYSVEGAALLDAMFPL
jgi:hypothetical protein